ncbi:RING finger domain and kelch repeat-containing protein DDB_G0271372-like [Saccostrea cucullata]|uniref:RING finger domain and kelch repeat-containing protein DDB_G0271372-like n=1 Tax=Saccostrea cuccullata TaxID=36930 RepID=UPI002ED58B1D
MSSMYSPRLKCGVCADLSILHSHCKQCGNLCENCSGLHSKGNAFKNHNVVPLTFSDGMETSSIKVEPSTQLDHLDSTPTATCITTADLLSTATNAPRPAYAPSTSSNDTPTPHNVPSTSNAPNTPKKKGVKRKATSVNAPTSHNVPSIPTNAPTSHNVPSTSNAPNTPKKKGVKRKATSVIMKEMKKAACPQSKHQSNTVDLCCQDCDQAICSQCLTTAHTDHRIGDITDFFGKKRAMIESDLDLIQSHIQQREEAKKQLAEDLKKMEQASENVVKEVKDFADKVRSTILKKADDLKASTKETKKRINSRNGEFVKENQKTRNLA